MSKQSGGYQPDTSWHKAVNWSNLRGFGQSYVGSVSMLMPFIGYFILYHNAFQPYLGGLGGVISCENEGECGPWLDFLQRLNFLYLGSFLLGCGTLVFRFVAHPAVRLHEDINDYVTKNAGTMTARNLRSMYQTIASRRPSVAGQLKRRAEWLDRNQVDLIVASDNFESRPDTSLLHDVMRSYFNVLDRYSSRKLAYLTTCIYLIGFLLVVIPGLDFTRRVLCSIYY